MMPFITFWSDHHGEPQNDAETRPLDVFRSMPARRSMRRLAASSADEIQKARLTDPCAIERRKWSTHFLGQYDEGYRCHDSTCHRNAAIAGAYSFQHRRWRDQRILRGARLCGTFFGLAIRRPDRGWSGFIKRRINYSSVHVIASSATEPRSVSQRERTRGCATTVIARATPIAIAVTAGSIPKPHAIAVRGGSITKQRVAGGFRLCGADVARTNRSWGASGSGLV
jgi:hypothetical protein